jgi:hypothetical protein
VSRMLQLMPLPLPPLLLLPPPPHQPAAALLVPTQRLAVLRLDALVLAAGASHTAAAAWGLLGGRCLVVRLAPAAALLLGASAQRVPLWAGGPLVPGPLGRRVHPAQQHVRQQLALWPAPPACSQGQWHQLGQVTKQHGQQGSRCCLHTTAQHTTCTHQGRCGCPCMRTGKGMSSTHAATANPLIDSTHPTAAPGCTQLKPATPTRAAIAEGIPWQAYCS